MRKTITTLLLLTTIFSVRTFGQKTISDLTLNAKKLSVLNAQNDFDASVGSLNMEQTAIFNATYDLDVFKYFKLYDYDTELKQAVFKKTEEYQNKLTELKSIKAEMLKTTYYVKIEDKFNDNNYDIKRKGFDINLGSNWGMGTMSARTPKSVGGILFKALPTKQVAESTIGKGIYSEELFLPISEEEGLEIENDKGNIDIYFLFTPTGKEKSVIKFLNSDGYWYNINHNDIKSEKVRVVVANKSSGKIYFDKTYSYQPSASKK